MYVYKITCKTTGLIYVGCTSRTPEIRLQEHFYDTKRELAGKRVLLKFHKAIAEFGIDDFVVEVIEKVNTIEEMYDREAYWIDKLNSTDPNIGYNNMTGGISGKKNKETKHRIGEKKKNDWKDKNLSKKMRDGLNKATDAWVKQCQNNRIEWVCPNCKKVLYLQPYIAKTKKFCSHKCASEVSSSIGLECATEINKKNTNERRELLKRYALDWIKENKNVVLNCPYNKISTNLSGLLPVAQEYLNASDWRVISNALCGSYSKKQMLDYMKMCV